MSSLLTYHREFTIGETDRRLFGSFVEHLGRAVYSGIFEPGHPQANPQGFRMDVLELVRELGVTVVRYPGGNFVSGYRWEDGVGPVEARPRRRELAWMATETNHFGTNEFMDWCRLAGIEPMMAVNLGTRGPADAADFLEYCNQPAGTALADLRRSHGYPKPHDIRLWCLGNEMDGPWQMGHCDAREYGRRAREAAKLMRYPDANRTSSPEPDIEFVACGSSSRTMPTFGQWELDMLSECYEQVHHVSLHTYYSCKADNPSGSLAQADNMNSFIREVAALCDAAGAAKRSARKLSLSFDEWNVWEPNAAREKWGPAWSVAPSQLEQVYTLLDALLVGGMAISLLNNVDRVRIACLAQLVNVIAPILTRPGGPAWRQTIFWPFHDFSRFGRGTVLKLSPASTFTMMRHRVAGAQDSEKESPAIQAAAVVVQDSGVHILALNRSAAAQDMTVRLEGFHGLSVSAWRILDGPDLLATNTEADPDRVSPRLERGARMENGALHATLPPFSWNVILLDAKP